MESSGPGRPRRRATLRKRPKALGGKASKSSKRVRRDSSCPSSAAFCMAKKLDRDQESVGLGSPREQGRTERERELANV